MTTSPQTAPDLSDHIITLRPEELLGYREGLPVDLDPYDRIGMRHPRGRERYDFFKQPPDVLLIRILDGILRSESIHNPILVYRVSSERYGECWAVLDGVTRLTAIARARKIKPGLFESVPCVVFTGSRTEALIEMIRRNMDGVRAHMDWEEIADAIQRFLNSGWTIGEIASKLALPNMDGAKMGKLLMLRNNATAPLRQAIVSGKLKMEDAIHFADAPPIVQNEAARCAMEGAKQCVHDKDQIIAGCLKRFKPIRRNMQGVERYLGNNALANDEIIQALQSFAHELNNLEQALRKAYSSPLRS